MSRLARLHRRVCLQSKATGVDAAGQPNGAWSTYREAYADIREPSGGELLRTEAVEHVGSLVIEIMYPRGGTFPHSEHRVQWIEGDTDETRTANITHIGRVDHDRKRLLLHCKEVDDG